MRDRLRLANAEYDRINSAAAALIGLHGIAAPPSPEALRALLFNAGREAARDALALAEAKSGALGPDAAFDAADRFLAEAPEPKLPFSGADLIARGVAGGPRIGQTLRAFQSLWIRAGFPGEPETLARLLDEAVAELARRGRQRSTASFIALAMRVEKQATISAYYELRATSSRVVLQIPVLEPQRTDARYLGDVFAGLAQSKRQVSSGRTMTAPGGYAFTLSPSNCSPRPMYSDGRGSRCGAAEHKARPPGAAREVPTRSRPLI